MMDVVNHINNDEIPTEGKIVDDQWNEGKYIATDSPITINGEHKGHVFMFAKTSYVIRAVDQLSNQFLIASLITVVRSEEHTSELQSRGHLVCRLLLEKKKE